MTNSDTTLPVYQHDKRPQWGMAILAWERGDKRGYLFEDGTLRVIGEPYYHFMKLSQADAESLSSSFRQQLAQMSRATADGMLGPERKSNPVFTIEEQAQLVVGQFPEGFSGEAWRHHHRGDPDKKKRLKRHRDGAIEEAKRVLDPKRIARAVTDQQHAELWNDICVLLQGTDLVTPRELKAMERRVSLADRSLSIALSGVLQNDTSEEARRSFDDRFAVFARELSVLLGKPPSWSLLTGLLALYAPDRYVAVHSASLRQQSKWLNESQIRSNPNAADYQRANATALKLFEHLQQLGLAPADLFDVHDFMRATTTPAAKKRLEALRQSDPRAVHGDAPTANDDDSDQEAA